MDEWKNSSKTYLLVKLMSDKLVKALTSMTLQLIGFFYPQFEIFETTKFILSTRIESKTLTDV